MPMNVTACVEKGGMEEGGEGRRRMSLDILRNDHWLP